MGGSEKLGEQMGVNCRHCRGGPAHGRTRAGVTHRTDDLVISHIHPEKGSGWMY